MNRWKPLLILCFIWCTVQSAAQDTLPRFSLRNIGSNRIIVGWVNAFPDIKQISIQRSFDSLGTYKTILTVADPRAVQNGYADTKAPNDHMYYRLFYVLEGSKFYFTTARRPVLDTASGKVAQLETDINKGKKADPVFGDAGVKKTVAFVPSFYVYTNRDGYVFVNLPDAQQKKYSLKFFEDDDTFLFELKNVKEPALTLDKSNFFHAGWFKFELYNDDKLVERHKFYLAKDF